MTLLYALRDRLPAILAVLAGLVLSACGGGDLAQPVTEKSFASAAVRWDSHAAASVTRRFALAASAAASSSPYGDALRNDAIEQLLNFGEASYAVYFPKHTETLTYQQYRYRYYPDTGVYLGVADGTGGTADGGVYVMGGPFGTAPTYVGPITSYITPVAKKHALLIVSVEAASQLTGGIPLYAIDLTTKVLTPVIFNGMRNYGVAYDETSSSIVTSGLYTPYAKLDITNGYRMTPILTSRPYQFNGSQAVACKDGTCWYGLDNHNILEADQGGTHIVAEYEPPNKKNTTPRVMKIVGDVVYISTFSSSGESDQIHRFNRKTKQFLPSIDIGNAKIRNMTVSDTTIYVSIATLPENIGNKVYAFDMQTGAKVASADVNSADGITTSGDMVYVASATRGGGITTLKSNDLSLVKTGCQDLGPDKAKGFIYRLAYQDSLLYASVTDDGTDTGYGGMVYELDPSTLAVKNNWQVNLGFAPLTVVTP